MFHLLHIPCLAVSTPQVSSRPTSARQVVCAATTAGSKLTEVDINTFDAALAAAGDKLVVLDMYTQWCGPCKMLAPKLESLAESYQDVVFIKLDCNQENKVDWPAKQAIHSVKASCCPPFRWKIRAPQGILLLVCTDLSL